MKPTICRCTLLVVLLLGSLASVTVSQAAGAEQTQPQATAAVDAQAAPQQPQQPGPGLADAIGRRGGPGSARKRPPPVVLPPPPIFDEGACITDPQEFAEEFLRGGSVRCVHDDIIVRIERDFEGNLTQPRHTKFDIIKNFIDGRAKVASFWSYGDNAEKYLRIGRPGMTLGNFVDNPPPTGLQAGAFPGIRDMRNFAALLEAIGYSSVDTDPKRPYVIVVTTKPKGQGNAASPPVAVYKPTWPNVVKYIQHYINNIAAADPQAFAAAQIDPSTAELYRRFKFDEETTTLLRTTTFADLTGCQAQCTVQDTTYGTPGIPAGPDTWTTPTRRVPRISGSECNLTTGQGGLPPPAERWELTEPTIIEEDDDHCDNSTARPYRLYQKLWQSKCTGRGANPTVNRALALRVAQAYMGEAQGLRRAIVLRTFLQTGCAGSFNALFSGDGYTYTGNGGFVGATGTEVHTGGLASVQDMPRVFPKIRLVFFCLVDVDGNPYPGNLCPDSVDAGFSDQGVKQLREYVKDPTWDIADVTQA